MPVRSLIACISGIRGQGGARSTSMPSRSTFVVPLAAIAAAATSDSVRVIASSTSAYASYHSSSVNSGLCLNETPSLRKFLPIS